MSNLARSMKDMEYDAKSDHQIESLHNSLKFGTDYKETSNPVDGLSNGSIDQLNEGFLDRLSQKSIQLGGSPTLLEEEADIYIEDAFERDEAEDIYCSPKHSR